MAVDIDLRDAVNIELAQLLNLEADLSSAVIGPDSPAFDALERIEHGYFPELEHLPVGNFAFWVVADNESVLHAMRLSFPTIANGLFAPFLAHEMVRSGQITAQELVEEFSTRGYELSQYVSVESSFRVMQSRQPAAMSSYLGLIQLIVETRRGGVLAHQNKIAQKSFDRAGLYSEPLSTKIDLRTPSLTEIGKTDVRYWPVLLPLENKNREILATFSEMVPVHLETFIDLRAVNKPSQTEKTLP